MAVHVLSFSCGVTRMVHPRCSPIFEAIRPATVSVSLSQEAPAYVRSTEALMMFQKLTPVTERGSLMVSQSLSDPDAPQCMPGVRGTFFAYSRPVLIVAMGVYIG